MKNNLLGILFIVTICLSLFFSNVAFASFAEFDDATADAQGEKDLKEQQELDAKKAEKSSNNYLSSLSVNGYELLPEFNKQVINYTIEDTVKAKSIEINATPDDNRATVSGTGKIDLYEGENNLKVEVTAENGVMRTYFIKLSTDKNIVLKNQIDPNDMGNLEENEIVNTEEQIENKISEKKMSQILPIFGIILIILLIILLRSKDKKNHKSKH